MSEVYTNAIISAVSGVLTLVFSVLGFYVTKFLNSKDLLNKNTLQGRIAGEIIQSIEQTGKDLTNSEKYEKAKKEIVKSLNQKGLKFNEKDIDTLIESSVYNIRNASSIATGNSISEYPEITATLSPEAIGTFNTFTDSKEGIIIDGELYVKSSSNPEK